MTGRGQSASLHHAMYTVPIHVYTYACMYIHVYTCTCVYVHVDVHIFVYIHVRVLVYVHCTCIIPSSLFPCPHSSFPCREMAVKFNDYFEFPRELNMALYTAAQLAKLEGTDASLCDMD